MVFLQVDRKRALVGLGSLLLGVVLCLGVRHWGSTGAVDQEMDAAARATAAGVLDQVPDRFRHARRLLLRRGSLDLLGAEIPAFVALLEALERAPSGCVTVPRHPAVQRVACALWRLDLSHALAAAAAREDRRGRAALLAVTGRVVQAIRERQGSRRAAGRNVRPRGERP